MFNSFIMKITVIVILFSNFLSGGEYKLLINDYYNPNRLVFRLTKGTFECSMLGVVVPYYSNTNECNTPAFKKMSYFSIGFFQNTLNLEQIYNVDIQDGYCIVKYGNKVLNEQVIVQGYGVVNTTNVSGVMLERLLELQSIAIQENRGLWADFSDEMNCFRGLY